MVTFGRLGNNRYYMVANSTFGQLKREKKRSCLRKWFRDERGSAVQSRVSPFHSPHSDREEPVIVLSATASIDAPNRHRASPEFIGSCKCVPIRRYFQHAHFIPIVGVG